MTGSLAPLAVYQIRRAYKTVIEEEATRPEVKRLTKILLKDFDERFQPEDEGKVKYNRVAEKGRGNRYFALHPYLFYAAFLDPRVKPRLDNIMTLQQYQELKNDIQDLMIKELKSQQEAKKKRAQEEVQQAADGVEVDNAAAPPPQSTSTSGAGTSLKDLMFGGFDEVGGDDADDAEDIDEQRLRDMCMLELNQFAHREVKQDMRRKDGSFSNPLNWWRDNESKYPTLAKLAVTFLAVPATSAPSERIWSRAARVLTAKRASLKSEVTSRIMFIRENAALLRKCYDELSSDDGIDLKEFLPPIEEEDGIDVGAVSVVWTHSCCHYCLSLSLIIVLSLLLLAKCQRTRLNSCLLLLFVLLFVGFAWGLGGGIALQSKADTL